MLCACSYQQNAQVSVSSNCIPYLFLNEDLYTEYDVKTVIPIQLNNENVVSRPRELPPKPLSEPYVNLSAHTAPIIQPMAIFQTSNERKVYYLF